MLFSRTSEVDLLQTSSFACKVWDNGGGGGDVIWVAIFEPEKLF